jgi:hypothetical protein
MLEAPKAAEHLRPIFSSEGAVDDMPVLCLSAPLLPAPPGGWREGSLRLLALLLKAAAAPLLPPDDNAQLLASLTIPEALDSYRAELAPMLLGIAEAAAGAPQLAAALGSCGFGQLAVMLVQEGGALLAMGEAGAAWCCAPDSTLTMRQLVGSCQSSLSACHVLQVSQAQQALSTWLDALLDGAAGIVVDAAARQQLLAPLVEARQHAQKALDEALDNEALPATQQVLSAAAHLAAQLTGAWEASEAAAQRRLQLRMPKATSSWTLKPCQRHSRCCQPQLM